MGYGYRIWYQDMCWCCAKSKARVKLIQKTGHLMYMQRHRDISIKQLKDNTMYKLKLYWFQIAIGLLVLIIAGLFIFLPNGNQDSAPMMYEDEMIVSIDDFTALQQSVITLQEGMKLLLAGEPQSPELTTEQEQFMCMQKTEDYKDGFLEISTILTCMNLQLTEQEQK